MKTINLPFSGKSMEGLIKDGDLLQAVLRHEPQKIEPLDFGKIVLTKQGQEWTVHRVVKNETHFCTKGDLSPLFDLNSDDYIWGEIVSLQNLHGTLKWPFKSILYNKFVAQLSSHYHSSLPRYIKGIMRCLLKYSGSLVRSIYTKKNSQQVFIQALRSQPLLLNDTHCAQIIRYATEHFLCTYMYNRMSPQNIEFFPQWKQKRKIDTLRMTIYIDELQNIRKQLPAEVNPCILKGMSLLRRVYENIGDRTMTDIDLLLDNKEASITEDVLLKNGYIKSNEDHGSANKSKSVWLKEYLGTHIVIEIHRKLLWFEPSNFKWSFTKSYFKGFKQLSTNDEIIYLCIHLSYNHNFQRLFWLTDLYEIFLKYEKDINWLEFSIRMQELKADKAVASVLYALRKIFKFQLSIWPCRKNYKYLNFLITENFLLSPYGSYFKYTLLKHLLQDSILNSLKYDYYRMMIAVRRRKLFSY